MTTSLDVPVVKIPFAVELVVDNRREIELLLTVIPLDPVPEMKIPETVYDGPELLIVSPEIVLLEMAIPAFDRLGETKTPTQDRLAPLGTVKLDITF
jgi:hypothetical protein